MDDGALLTAFESQTIPHAEWNHRAHVRVAYLYLVRHEFDAALDRMRRGIQALNLVLGVQDSLESGYHETLTHAFLRIIHTTIKTFGPAESSDEFCDQQPQLLQRKILRLFYSRARIVSWEAKRTFVEPDLAPFPRHKRE
jgi:hypothetical protein